MPQMPSVCSSRSYATPARTPPPGARRAAGRGRRSCSASAPRDRPVAARSKLLGRKSVESRILPFAGPWAGNAAPTAETARRRLGAPTWFDEEDVIVLEQARGRPSRPSRGRAGRGAGAGRGRDPGVRSTARLARPGPSFTRPLEDTGDDEPLDLERSSPAARRWSGRARPAPPAVDMGEAVGGGRNRTEDSRGPLDPLGLRFAPTA